MKGAQGVMAEPVGKGRVISGGLGGIEKQEVIQGLSWDKYKVCAFEGGGRWSGCEFSDRSDVWSILGDGRRCLWGTHFWRRSVSHSFIPFILLL